jgi:hypothetical protein
MQFKVLKILKASQAERVGGAIQRAAVNRQDAFRFSALVTRFLTRPPIPARQDISATPSRAS